MNDEPTKAKNSFADPSDKSNEDEKKTDASTDVTMTAGVSNEPDVASDAAERSPAEPPEATTAQTTEPTQEPDLDLHSNGMGAADTSDTATAQPADSPVATTESAPTTEPTPTISNAALESTASDDDAEAAVAASAANASDVASERPSQPAAEPVEPEQKPFKLAFSGRKFARMVVLILVVLAIAAGAFAAYKWGNSRGYTNGKKAAMSNTPAVASLTVPTNATIISQCTPGEGTQYVEPKNIPMGPIYNVWQNKVIGIEYMLPQSEIVKTGVFDLLAKSQTYDHIDVMYEAQGHAGLTEPHYHVVMSMVPYTLESQITCGASSGAKHGTPMM